MALEPFFELESIANRDPELYTILQKMADVIRGNTISESGNNDPNGKITAIPNSMYIQRNLQGGKSAAIWVKTGPAPGSQGWVKIHEVSGVGAPQTWANTYVDPTQNGFRTQGSIPPTGSTSFTYTSTVNSITWFWDGTAGSSVMAIYRADGSVVANISGNQTITGLANATPYYFYPYYDEPLQKIVFAAVTGGTGIPNAAYLARSLAAAQIQNLRNNIPLSPGGMLAVTGGGSGSGGGSAACFHQDTIVKLLRSNVSLPILEVFPGDRLLSEGSTEALVTVKACHQTRSWIVFTFDNGVILKVTPPHALDGKTPAVDLPVGAEFKSYSGERARIVFKEAVEYERDVIAVNIKCGETPWLYAVGSADSKFSNAILVHNVFKI